MAKITKAVFDSTSPTVQYGNVHTVIEVEGDDWEQMRDLGLSKIHEVDEMVSPTPFKLKKASDVGINFKNITSRLTGVTLKYDELLHTYKDANGNTQLSGSAFPDLFYDSFDKVKVIESIQKAYPEVNIDAQDLLKMWDNNSLVSTSYGTAVHMAMENYINFHKMGDSISKADDLNKSLSKNALFSKIVQSYVDKFGIDGMISEEFIADGHGHCGRMDYVKIIDKDKKIVRIGDYKTDANLFEKKYQKASSPFKDKILNEKGKEDATLLTYHRFQMSYYAYILSQFGYAVEGLDLDWLNPATLEWERHSVDVIDLSDYLKGIEL